MVVPKSKISVWMVISSILLTIFLIASSLISNQFSTSFSNSSSDQDLSEIPSHSDTFILFSLSKVFSIYESIIIIFLNGICTVAQQFNIATIATFLILFVSIRTILFEMVTTINLVQSLFSILSLVFLLFFFFFFFCFSNTNILLILYYKLFLPLG